VPALHCRVHGAPMSERTVRPSYGLPVGDPSPFYEAMERDFPNAGVGPLGGCCVPPAPPTWREPVCPKCVEAARTWRPA
jgi:hypothetical protein